MAQQRNKAPLPRVLRNEWGVRLPSERFVLTGLPWGLKSEWGVDEKEAIKADGMEGVEMEEQGWEGGEEGATMEDLFSGDPDPDIDKMIERKKGMP
jgi:transcription initiation factor TFIID subunit 9B